MHYGTFVWHLPVSMIVPTVGLHFNVLAQGGGTNILGYLEVILDGFVRGSCVNPAWPKTLQAIVNNSAAGLAASITATNGF